MLSGEKGWKLGSLWCQLSFSLMRIGLAGCSFIIFLPFSSLETIW
jgi:hypothetical protein